MLLSAEGWSEHSRRRGGRVWKVISHSRAYFVLYRCRRTVNFKDAVFRLHLPERENGEMRAAQTEGKAKESAPFELKPRGTNEETEKGSLIERCSGQVNGKPVWRCYQQIFTLPDAQGGEEVI